LKNTIDKYCLGTAQLGIKGYGINNPSSTLPKGEDFFNYIINQQIPTIDTSVYYGDINNIISKYNQKQNLDIYTKISLKKDINSFFKETGLEKVKGCYIHHFSDYIKDKNILKNLQTDKKNGKVDEIGFSIYYEHELINIIEDDLDIQIIQLPHNIFDQRFESYFPLLKERNIKIITRSCFLQGMFFKDEKYFNDSKLNKVVSEKIAILNSLSKKHNISIAQICYHFSASNPNIDKVIIGTDNLNQLQNNIKDIKEHNNTLFSNIKEELYPLKEDNLKIILPSLWENNKTS
jgi:aryl-alcohol dehydrogenase-like predicted oxidoreductase